MRQKALCALIVSIISLVFLYIFADKIANLSFQVMDHFYGTESTRDSFFIDKYDIFYKAGEGMLLAFWGPTLSEALNGHLLELVSFLESAAIAGILLAYTWTRLSRTPFYGFVLCAFGLFWLLFANYPLGVMNPGSAVRYRTGYLLLVIMIFTVFLSRRTLARWSIENRRALA